ncbi:MAG: hypothetical protein CEE43_02065 [Promethearchaeota archaeon Loki_b32]|nr:MAG: hypothetical protein CEE43_02065 [Candidatus Lokiarchaeota archaeon Loki_b32]
MGAGVADTDKVDLPDSPGLDFKIETLYEDEDNSVSPERSKGNGEKVSLIQVKGIGKRTVENLNANGISTISDLLAADPEELSANINGTSPKTISEWQTFWLYWY